MTSRDFISSYLPTTTNVEIGIGGVALASIFELFYHGNPIIKQRNTFASITYQSTSPPHSPCTQTSLYTLEDRSHFSHPNHLSENRTAEEEVPFTSTYMKFSYSNGLDPNLQDQIFYF